MGPSSTGRGPVFRRIRSRTQPSYFSLLGGNFRPFSRDGFAGDCLLQRGVRSEPCGIWGSRRPPSINSAVAALRFFFTVTLDRPDLARRLTIVREPRRLPAVLSVEEVTLLLQAAPGRLFSAEGFDNVAESRFDHSSNLPCCGQSCRFLYVAVYCRSYAYVGFVV